jgi:hypothetical protein
MSKILNLQKLATAEPEGEQFDCTVSTASVMCNLTA